MMNKMKKNIYQAYQILFDFNSKKPITVPIGMTKEERELLWTVIVQSKKYLEFGSGGSTFIALKNTEIDITSVDSDNAWFEYMRKWKVIRKAEMKGKLHFHYVNIGRTGMWGNPVDESCKEQYPEYSSSIFRQISDFDTVLVDGRFRVACVLQIVLNCGKKVKILVHDFNVRTNYEEVLQFLEEEKHVGELYLFKVRDNIDMDCVKKSYEKYKYDYR